MVLRNELWSRGIRYRKNCTDLPGKPDIAFKGKKVAVFCDSEFWHGYNWEKQKHRIGTRPEYWIPKIERNMKRDMEVTQELEQMGYIVIRFWGKEILNNPSLCADKIETVLRNR